LKNSADLESALSRFLPENAISLACDLLRAYPHHLIITGPRSTKHGHFKAGMRNERHEITVNGNLNKYAFLITLVHEAAHLIAHLRHGHRIKPHGEEWKSSFREAMKPFFGKDIFPTDIEIPLRKYMLDPGATTHSDYALFKALSSYDRMSPNVRLLDDIPENTLFIYGRDRRVFKKGPRLKKRYQCTELSTKSIYLFDPLAKVMLHSDDL
jgi:hypothetical protein